jgi:precorrin-6A/cobalt-precorrin-6A reductase
LIDRFGVGLLVTKDSGGKDAKLAAARAKGIPVVMVRRPPPVAEHSFANVRDVCAWLASLAS